ncbi:hypothetical protein K7X08_020232 [Anisodus acutangulus]|uniref:F-box associated domain-containing protein n=1 Tax=Anisodus acutangulus TaxID=402998 RepID=A0A9Q1M935_9SOLA|nr:hypothetical protein K7X08_020232 [Anisodus acutangulus]
MDKEEISTMPHPGSICSSWITHETMSLLVKDESLCLCQLFIFEDAMDIWILEDYETWVWTKRCKVNLVFNNEVICRSMPFGNLSYWQVVFMSWQIQPLHFQDGELPKYKAFQNSSPYSPISTTTAPLGFQIDKPHSTSRALCKGHGTSMLHLDYTTFVSTSS